MTTLEKVKASKAKCKRHRDNWKAKALAYREIIERAKNTIRFPYINRFVVSILNEADKVDGK